MPDLQSDGADDSAADDSEVSAAPVPHPPVYEVERIRIDDLLRDADAVPKAPYRDRRNEQKLTQRTDEHNLRKTVATWVYLATGGQVIIADVAFYLYAWLGRDWDVPPEAIGAWLTATVVQVVAVLLVITRYLFPGRRRKP